eukprot:GFUD01024683.1.p1 GENE.GFUD01024683.1~~GFUD01024683.1.p1  ORF type:complete len:570 (-),score=168.18 GFUD01024683.1:67-1776(-)
MDDDEKESQEGVNDDNKDTVSEDSHNRDAGSSRSSRTSEYEEDSIFEPDLDYEPEEDSNDDDVELKNGDAVGECKNPSEDPEGEIGRKLQNDRFKRSFLSSDDDDIEVVDVINNETSRPKEGKVKEERKEHTRGRNYSRPRVLEEESFQSKEEEKPGVEEEQSCSRSPRRRESRSNTKESNSLTSSRSTKREKSHERGKRSDRDRVDSSNQERREIKYTREDLEKVKAFFTGAQNKRKDSESHSNKSAAKKFKGNDGREWKDSKEDWLKEKLEKEGKVYIRNYIPFPSSQKSNFKRDIQSAFKDELNEDILTTLTTSYCGLCFKDFDDDVVAWKHYTGTNHKSTIKRFNRGTYKGHPPFWRMVHERLCEKDPGTLTEQEIFDQVCDNYNVGDNREKVKSLVKRNIDCLMQYEQIGLTSNSNTYFVKNKNVQKVGKIFENYFFDKKRKEEVEHQRKLNSSEDYKPAYRTYEERRSSNHRRSYEFGARTSSSSRYPEDRRPLPSRHSSSSGYPATFTSRSYGESGTGHEGGGRNPVNQMLVVDPSKLRMLPNGQIMIKQDDVMSIRPGEVV